MSSRWCRRAEGGVLVGNHKKLSYTRKWAYVKGLSVQHFYNPHPSISRGGRPMYILRLADDIDFMAATDSQLQASPTGCSTDMEWRPGLVRANSWLTPTGKLISTSTEFEDMKRYKYTGQLPFPKRHLHQDGDSTHRNVQAEQDVAQQDHQVCYHLQIIQILCNSNPAVQTWDTDLACQYTGKSGYSRVCAWGRLT